MLVFGPELAGGRDPFAALEAALPWVDLVQVRPKPRGARVTSARDAFDTCTRVLELLERRGRGDLPVLVNDRVDVALALAGRVAGVHLGQDDLAPEEARALLGPVPLIGVSTHDAAQVARALEGPADYLGYGPVFPSATKGYATGLGPERAWVVAAGADRPVFPIGGIDPQNADTLVQVGRAAVGAAILGDADPAAAAASLAALLVG